MGRQSYLETGVAGGRTVVGAETGLAGVLMAVGLPGKKSGPFCPHALSRLTSVTVATAATSGESAIGRE